jgi:hypothetical protein
MSENDDAFHNQLGEDYNGALIRLATLRAEGEQYLLFAWVELFPPDMNVPNGWYPGKKPWSVPGQDWTLGFKATKVTVADALDWYETAAAGTIKIGNSRPLQMVQIGAEPVYRQFCTGVDVPFAFRWHDGPRVHRYVPLSANPWPVRRLCAIAPAREWLETHLGFDPLRFDEWLGGLALIAPDPVCASFAVFPSARAENGSETLTIHAVPRRRATGTIADLSTLSIYVAERRIDGWSTALTVPFDASGHATIVNPQPCNQVGYAVVCSKRGLLRLVEPLSRIEQIGVGMNISSSTLRVEVPSGGRRKPAKRIDVQRFHKGADILVGKPLNDAVRKRLVALREHRKAREQRAEAPQRIFGIASDKAGVSEAEIKKKRKEAEDFVGGVVRSARRRLLFVDPFFGYREMRLFALQASNHGVMPRILTGLPGLAGTPEQPVPPGDLMVADLAQLKQQPALQAPQVRVMPGKKNPVIHDRYLVVDDEVWHCGPSFNELGERLGVMVRLPDPLSVRRFLSTIWGRSQSLAEFWQENRASLGGQP